MGKNACKYGDYTIAPEATSHSLAERYIQKQKDSLSPSFEEQHDMDDFFPIPSAYSWIQGVDQSTIYNCYSSQNINISDITDSRNRTDLSDIHIDVGISIKEMAENNHSLKKMLNIVSSELGKILTEQGIKSHVDVKLDSDIEFPDWEEIVINVKIANLENPKLLEVWDLIESKLRVRTDSILEDTDKEKYGNYIIVVNHLNDGTDL